MQSQSTLTFPLDTHHLKKKSALPSVSTSLGCIPITLNFMWGNEIAINADQMGHLRLSVHCRFPRLFAKTVWLTNFLYSQIFLSLAAIKDWNYK